MWEVSLPYDSAETAVVAGKSMYLGTPFSTHLVIVFSWLVTILTAHLIALVLQTEATDEERQFMWAPVVRGGEVPATAASETV